MCNFYLSIIPQQAENKKFRSEILWYLSPTFKWLGKRVVVYVCAERYRKGVTRCQLADESW